MWYINIQWFAIKEWNDHVIIALKHFSTKFNIINIFTKGLCDTPQSTFKSNDGIEWFPISQVMNLGRVLTYLHIYFVLCVYSI